MSLDLDYAEITRRARLIVDANRARAVTEKLALESGSDGGRQAKRPKFTRSTKGCMGCRKQKVKCDETQPSCLRCVAAQKQCEYQKSTEGSSKRRKTAESTSPLNGESSKSQTREVDTTGTGMDSMSMDPSLDQLFNFDGWSPMPNIIGNAGTNGNTSVQPMETFDASFIPTDFDFLTNFTPFTYLPTISPKTSPSQDIALANNQSSIKPATTASSSRLPQFQNLGKSSLLNRRQGKGKKSETPAPMDTSISTRLAMVTSMLQAFEYDIHLFEFSPSQTVLRTVIGVQAISSAVNVETLSNAFPSPTARTLFNHYCNVTIRFLVTMGNIGPNPLLTLCTPVNLLDTASASSAAIRMSILSISAAHFAHETTEILGLAAKTPMWMTQRASLRAMSDKFKKAALSNITLAAVGPESSNDETDRVLAACTLLCIRDVICADPTWRENLEFSMNIISKKGGPQAMLSGTNYSFLRRFLLENLATHDVFSSFITGKEPACLGNYDTWWFESVKTSQTRWEWESTERTFGMSRAMVDLVARIAKLDSRKRRLAISLKNPAKEMWDVSQHFIRESQCLLLELDIWGNSLAALPQNARVTCGDYIYKYMSTIFLMADVMEQPTTTPRIIKCVEYVLELCAEAAAMRMSVMLMWPILIAGVFCLPDARPRVSSLLDALALDYFEDLIAAREILEEQWRCIDFGQGKQPWPEVMMKLNRFVLLI